MKAKELTKLGPHQLLDVRLPDDFNSGHISGAKNNCVFEMTFTVRLAESAPDTSQTTIVYGANPQSHEALAAAEKLRRLGYADVHILEGGLEAAIKSGVQIVGGSPLPTAPAPIDGTRQIDINESRLEWLGRNLLNKHWGTAALESGHLVFDHGTLTGGEFVVDLTRLECTDLAGSDLHDVLIAHLHNDDFFDVENHPKAKFVMTAVSNEVDASPGSCNLTIDGDLTLRGQTHPIQFTAAAGFTEKGMPAAQAAFSIDRTRWSILYGSGKFFNRLAGHLVNDLLEFQLRIVTQ